MTEENNTPEKTEAAPAGASLSDEEKNEFASLIANDIYRRATLAQTIQLVQTQCTNQAASIIENATEEEIESFRKQIAESRKESESAESANNTPQ